MLFFSLCGDIPTLVNAIKLSLAERFWGNICCHQGRIQLQICLIYLYIYCFIYSNFVVLLFKKM